MLKVDQVYFIWHKVLVEGQSSPFSVDRLERDGPRQGRGRVARLREPSVLILDEATSALDSENEKRIQSAIEELH
jgi:ABC-type phosphate transport system ATPase subunit